MERSSPLQRGNLASRRSALASYRNAGLEDHLVQIRDAVRADVNAGREARLLRQEIYKALAKVVHPLADEALLWGARHESDAVWVDLNYILSGRRSQLPHLRAALAAALDESPMPRSLVQRLASLLDGHAGIDAAWIAAARERAGAPVAVPDEPEAARRTLHDQVRAALEEPTDAAMGRALWAVRTASPSARVALLAELETELVARARQSSDGVSDGVVVELLQQLGADTEVLREVAAPLADSVAKRELFGTPWMPPPERVRWTSSRAAVLPLGERVLMWDTHGGQVELHSTEGKVAATGTAHALFGAAVVPQSDPIQVVFTLDKARRRPFPSMLGWLECSDNGCSFVGTKNVAGKIKSFRPTVRGVAVLNLKGKLVLTGPKRARWSRETLGAERLARVEATDPERLYVLGQGLDCLNLKTGELLFHNPEVHAHPGMGRSLDVLRAGGRLYCLSDHLMFELDADSGETQQLVVLPFQPSGMKATRDGVWALDAPSATERVVAARPPGGFFLPFDGRGDLRPRSKFAAADGDLVVGHPLGAAQVVRIEDPPGQGYWACIDGAGR